MCARNRDKEHRSWRGMRWCCAPGRPNAQPCRLARDETYRCLENGEISDAEYFAALRSSLGVELSAAQFLEGWNEIFAGEMPGIAPLLKRAAKRLPLYAFSNTNGAHVEHFSKT